MHQLLQQLKFLLQEFLRFFLFVLLDSYRAKDVDIHANGDYLLSAKVGKSGVIKIAKDNKIGRILVDAINVGEKIEVFV